MFITRITIYAIVAVALAAFVTLLPCLQHPNPDSTIYKISSTLFLLSDIAIAISMYQNGYTHKTKYKRYLQFTIFVLLVGYLMRAEGTTSAIHAVNIALLAIPPIYLMSYLSKPGKKLADHGKLIYVVSFCALTFLRDNKIFDNIYVTFLSQVMLWCLFADTTIRVLRREREIILKTAETVDAEAEVIK